MRGIPRQSRLPIPVMYPRSQTRRIPMSTPVSIGFLLFPGLLWGDAVAQGIQLGMEYTPEPPRPRWSRRSRPAPGNGRNSARKPWRKRQRHYAATGFFPDPATIKNTATNAALPNAANQNKKFWGKEDGGVGEGERNLFQKVPFSFPHISYTQSSSDDMGVNPRRMVFSVTTRGSMNWSR